VSGLEAMRGFRFADELLLVQAFPTIEEANAFLTGSKLPTRDGTPRDAEPTRFYGIQRGRIPGVYTDWAKAQEQIRGFTKPRYKKFSTREEAQEFVKLGQGQMATFATSDSGPPKPSAVPGMVDGIPKDAQGVPFEPGDGPLPPGAEDGFDPNVLLDPATGKVVYKTPEQKSTTKTKATGPPGMLRIYTDGSSLKNGRTLAAAGVGVYFGPDDTRCASLRERIHCTL
jgi:ribonuclease HI